VRLEFRQVAIVGLAPSTHDDAPYEDPGWEAWGLPWDNDRYPYFDRLFDIHPLECIREATPSFYHPDYEDRLRELDAPLYMQQAYGDIPNAIAYPLDEISSIVGDYYNSSIAYMLAMAIVENVDKIGLWGVDMSGSGEPGHANEYRDERPNCEYLLGFAKAKGIEIYLPEECPLLKFGGIFPLGNVIPNYGNRYGYLALQ
tara:strand:- start:47 stop:646 length:600 start_codon:yes stop_codon:yes gene_type:complete